MAVNLVNRDMYFIQRWEWVFMSGLSTFCGKQPLKIYLVQSWILCPMWEVAKWTERKIMLKSTLETLEKGVQN